MKSHPLSRSRISAGLIAGLVISSIVTMAPAAQAIDPATPTSFRFMRADVAGDMTIKDGEQISLSSQTIVDETYSRWPLAKGAVLSRSAFAVTPNANVTIVENGDWRVWSGWSTVNESCTLDSNATKLTITNSTKCIDFLNVSDDQIIRNESGSEQTVETNALTQVLKNGKKTMSGAGITTDLYGWVQVDDVSSYTLSSPEEADLNVDFEVCLVEESLSPEDNLTLDVDITRGGSSIASEDYTVYDWNDLDGDELTENDLTYTVSPDGPEDDLRITLSVSLASTTSGAYSGTLDVTRGGTSVIETCADSETPLWPTVTNTNEGGAGTPQATITSATWSDAAGVFENADWEAYSHAPDGFGGMYYWNSPETPGGDARVVNLGPTAGDADFNGSGYIDLETDEYGYLEMGSYGTAGSNYMAVVETSPAVWKVSTGSKSTAANNASVTLTKKTLSKLCPTDFSAAWLSLISAPTTNPILYLQCRKGSLYRPVIASLVAGKAVKLATPGKQTTKRPCVVPNTGIDTNATGTEPAIVMYTRTSSRDDFGFCTSEGVTVSSRTLTTISANGVVSTATNLSDPWGEDGEPAHLEIAAGTNAGEWIGLTYLPGGGGPYGGPSPIGSTFTINGSTLAVGGAIELDADVNFGDFAFAVPVAKESSTKWTIAIEGSVTEDGANVGLTTVANINPVTGAVTNGDVVRTTGMGFFSARILDRISTNSTGRVTLYTVTGDSGATSQYKATTWGTDAP